MKKWSFAIAVLFMTLIFISGVKEIRAADVIPDERLLPRLVDDADVLTDSEEALLLEKLDKMSEKYQCDIVINTFLEADYESMEQYTDDYFDYNGFGYGEKGDRTGIVLAMDYKERNWHISTGGEAIWAMSDAIREEMGDAFLPYLSNGDAYKGFDTFIDLSAEVMRAYQAGESPNITEDYDIPEAKHTNENATGTVEYAPKKDNTWMRILIGLGAGLLIALLVVWILTEQLNTVVEVKDASNYEVEGSFRLHYSDEYFLYRTLTKTKRAKSSDSGGGGSSVHTSSSGSSHGGGGGKF